MKIFSIVLTLCFSLNVFAQTNSIEALEKSFNEYQYAMTVEWDQKDEKFLQKQNELISQKLSSLMKEGEVTKETLLAFAEKKMGNQESFSALKLKVSLLPDSASAEEVLALFKSEAKDLYVQGASWNGEVLYYAAAAIVTLFYIQSIYSALTYECLEYASTDTYRCEIVSSYNDFGEVRSVSECGYKAACIKSNRD